MATTNEAVERIQRLIGNALPERAFTAPMMAGSIGESPSKYSRSPGMWNAALQDVGLDVAYVPLDVSKENLPSFVRAIREHPGFIGGNVTVPHKLAIMGLLDEVDDAAKRIGAVNTFERTPDNRLVGHNTDGAGLIGSLLRPLPGQLKPFVQSLSGLHALVIGAGGAGKAASFGLADQLGEGRLTITNRSLHRAEELASHIAKVFPNVDAIAEQNVPNVFPHIDLVVNASTVGQSGLRHLENEKATCLEPFSSLAPAEPAVVDTTAFPGQAFYREWFAASWPAIQANNNAAARLLLACKPSTLFVDVVYSPDETVLLRQARLSGHASMNGKGMLIMQAATSFIQYMTRRHLIAKGLEPDTLYERVFGRMAAAY